MSLWWELEYEVNWRPRQVVYIRTETDISALTNPNKKQAVCYPANAGGGDKGRREKERGGRMSGRAGMRGECPGNETISTSLSQSQRRQTTVSMRG